MPGRNFGITIADRIDAAIVMPEVENYPADQIELIAPVGVRDALGLVDGDLVRIEIVAE